MDLRGSADYELALRIVEHTNRIQHIPKILYHWRAAPHSMASTSETKPESFESGRRAVEQAIQRRGIAASVEQPSFAKQARIGVYRLRFRGTCEFRLTIIIPSKDKTALLRNCIDSIEKVEETAAYQIWII